MDTIEIVSYLDKSEELMFQVSLVNEVRGVGRYSVFQELRLMANQPSSKTGFQDGSGNHS